MASDIHSRPARFFILNKLTHGEHDTEFMRDDDAKFGSAPQCPRCGAFVGLLSWEPPYRGELELYGKGFGDLMRGPGYSLLVSERFANDFKAEGLTGLSGFHPVEIVRVRRKRRGPKPGPPPRYFMVMPSYGSTALDMERSHLWSKKPYTCTWCRSTGIDGINGVAIDAATWSGEDIFRPRGLSGRIVVSERFVRFAEKHAMSHYALVPTEKFVDDPSGHFYPRPMQLDPPNKG